MNKKRSFALLITAAFLISGYFMYNYSKWVCAYKYAYGYNNKDFEKIYYYLSLQDQVRKFSKEEIIGVLKEQSGTKDKIGAKDLEIIRDPITKKCYVKFPYKLQDINIIAPKGADIYVDNRKVIENLSSDKGIKVKNLLPGKHRISINYYKNMYPSFYKEVSLPRDNYVISPYITQDIVISAPKDMWVKVGPVKKQIQDEKIIINNMLLGKYDVYMFMNDQKLEVLSREIDINNSTQLNFNGLEGNNKIINEVQQFFNGFNWEYKKGIIEKNTNFMYRYLIEGASEDIITDFQMWYISNKDIEDANSLMEVRRASPISGDSLNVIVLETVYLTNNEKDSHNENIKKEYRVVIEWAYEIVRDDSSWKIISRRMLQSIVAYKNEQESWIKY